VTKNTAPILIIDDDADIRDVMKVILEASGYCVRVAADGFDALEQLQAGTLPAMILLDLMMPRMDGEQFLKQIRESPFANIPVVIMSGHLAGRKNTSQLGAACYLKKPVEFDELLKTVRQFVPAHSSDEVA
jgi:CheY-like chemotaxis protein